MDKTLLFIVNPRAGKTKSSAPLFDAVATFGKAGYLVKVALTQAAGDAARFAAQWGGDFDLVVCAGGDGTLNGTLSGLMQLENRPPVGYPPNGRTNGVAGRRRLPTAVQHAAGGVVEGTPHPLDLGAHNDRYVSYVASFGAFTKASYSASQETKNALGHFAYILEGIKNLDSLRPYRCGVEADGESFDGDFIFGGVSNSTSVAGMVRLRKDLVSLGDGLFETLLIRRPKQFGDLSRIITGVLNQYSDNENVILVQSKNLRFTFEEPVAWTRDGEAGGVTTDVTLRNNHAAIHIIA